MATFMKCPFFSWKVQKAVLPGASPCNQVEQLTNDDLFGLEAVFSSRNNVLSKIVAFNFSIGCLDNDIHLQSPSEARGKGRKEGSNNNCS